GCGDRGNRKPDHSEQVIDALLFEAPRYQRSAVDFTHAFLLLADDFLAAKNIHRGRGLKQYPPRAARLCPCRPCRAIPTARCRRARGAVATASPWSTGRRNALAMRVPSPRRLSGARPSELCPARPARDRSRARACRTRLPPAHLQRL